MRLDGTGWEWNRGAGKRVHDYRESEQNHDQIGAERRAGENTENKKDSTLVRQ